MTNERDVRSVAEQFYSAAYAVLHGDVEPMLALWSHGEDASYCDTRGEIVMGWPALEEYWRRAAAINAAAPGEISATSQITHAVVNGDFAYAVALEEVHKEGESSVMLARATLIYRREKGGDWLLLHRHTDAPPKSRAWEQS